MCSLELVAGSVADTWLLHQGLTCLTLRKVCGGIISGICVCRGVPMFALPYYRFTVTQFIKGQELFDKEHLVHGT